MRVLVLAAAAAVSCSAAFAQAPPMKMGLWETTSVSTMQMPPAIAAKMAAAGMAAGGVPQTTTIKSCITAESWQKSMAHMNSPRGDCTYTDKTITTTGMTFAMSCTGRTTSNVKGVVKFDGPEKSTSTVHMEMVMPTSSGGGGSMATDVKATSRFIGADCGDVKPFVERAPAK